MAVQNEHLIKIVDGVSRMIKKGDIVDIKDEYQDEGDHLFIWMAVKDEANGSVLITPINIAMTIKPISLVKTKWIKKKLNSRRYLKKTSNIQQGLV
jgi:uncharacterized membrane protein